MQKRQEDLFSFQLFFTSTSHCDVKKIVSRIARPPSSFATQISHRLFGNIRSAFVVLRNRKTYRVNENPRISSFAMMQPLIHFSKARFLSVKFLLILYLSSCVSNNLIMCVSLRQTLYI